MRELSDVLELLAYHPATTEAARRYAHLRQIAMTAAADAWELIPAGPEKTLAMRGLQDFLLHANCAVAMTTPADLDTPHIARVLPTHVGSRPVAAGATPPAQADALPGGPLAGSIIDGR